jgi:hypothetical protein
MKIDIITFLTNTPPIAKTEKTGKQKLLGVILGCILTAKSENRGDSIKREWLEVALLLCFLSFLRFPKFPKFLRFLRFLRFLKTRKQKLLFLSFLSFLKIEKQKYISVVEV